MEKITLVPFGNTGFDLFHLRLDATDRTLSTPFYWFFIFDISLQIVTSSYTDLQDYTYYFVPAPWLSVKLLRLMQMYGPPDDPAHRGRLNECLETILNKAQVK